MVVVAIAGPAEQRDAMATQLIETLCGRGRSVAVIAASPDLLAVDTPGKDSYEHAAAGACDVVVVSGRRWARVHRNDPPVSPRMAALAALAEDADVVLALGFDDHASARLTVEPGADSEPGLALRVLAEDGRRPAFRLDKPEAIADLIERFSEEVN